MVDDATVTSVKLSEINNVTFSDGTLTVSKTTSEAATTVSLSDITKITFGDYTGSSTETENALEEAPQSASVLIYGTDAVHISCSEGINAVTIVSLNGAQVFSQRYSAQPTEVVADGILAKGLYVVSVETQNKRISQKISIK